MGTGAETARSSYSYGEPQSSGLIVLLPELRQLTGRAPA